MSDQQCDIHDVTQSASDLMSLGCTAGSTHFYDSLLQVQFSSFIANYVNGIIREVNDGTMSAWEGVQRLPAEHAVLLDKIMFYAQNGISVIGGIMQVSLGIEVIGTTSGVGVVFGGPMIAHGINNIYEGGMNIYNGPEAPSTVGPVRDFYRGLVGSDYRGDILYSAIDLGLSAYGLTRFVRKDNVPQLFRSLPEDYERAYKQSGTISLIFEAIVDSLTAYTMWSEDESSQ